MKISIPIVIAVLGVTPAAWAQSPSPASSTTGASAAAKTDMYHVHLAKSALGKSAELAEVLKKQDPAAPMKGHYIVLRHQTGDAWDYCVIEHLGTKATVEATRPNPPSSQIALGDWHTDTFVVGPPWAEFAKQLGVDDASKTTASAYVVSVYRPAAGQYEAVEKFLGEPPDRTTDTSSGNVLLRHMEGAAWTFMTITRWNAWADYAKDTTNSIAKMAKDQEAGWFKNRNLISFHTDTLCDRITP
ncbi:MAG: hypothetical protein ABR589_10130 [Chthoniobacterales bacterium]